ncbi:MAG: prepilin-type N-terminal cleavage/methylation domain-containing protein [Verrucomicrobiaceae bacterium]|nr:MAG: prepilin-type N-terminal cleavage/methylation domain-containing protein [Verrucomicrobiaceae bacterium]
MLSPFKGHTVYCSHLRGRIASQPTVSWRRRRQRDGFSLIEMVVVVGIIAVIAAIGMTAFSGGGPGVLLSTSTAQVSSMLSGARQLAVSQNCRTRFYILLNEDPNKPEWRLRGYGILKEELGVSDGSKGVFVPATGLNLLREGIYFQRELPEEGETDPVDPGTEPESGEERKPVLDRTPELMSFQNIDGVKYAFIEFLPTGGTETASAYNILRLERGLEPGVSMPNQTNYVRIGVAKHTGRVKIERPEIQ